MGFLDLMHLLSIQRQRDQGRRWRWRWRRRQAEDRRPRDGLVATSRDNKRKGSPCQRDDSQGGAIEMHSGQTLPEDIYCHIHSLMPMRDAARFACVSRAFLRSWRRHPDLTFDAETLGFDAETLGSDKNACGEKEMASDFSSKVDQILTKHSGIGVKRLELHLVDYNSKDSCHLNRWLQTAVTPGIEELTLSLPMLSKYKFPYSLLCNGSGDSIRSFCLSSCSLNPTAELGWLRRLTRLHLSSVRIVDDKFACLLSNSFSLQQLVISQCNWLFFLKVPCLLQQLSYLVVSYCSRLQTIDLEAPNISSFHYSGFRSVQLSLGEKLQMKVIEMAFSGAVHYACVELPSSMPNLETLSICSYREVPNMPMPTSKFLHLKNLRIALSSFSSSWSYDYFSLVSFLDACPSLEAVILDASCWKKEDILIFTDDSDLRQMREHHHHKMKRVEILGFSHVKSLVELTCHIVESAMSLECLKLDASHCIFKCSDPGNISGKCSRLLTTLMEARRAVSAIRTYIEPKVSSTVKLNVVEPCRRCHDVVTLDV